MERDAEGRRFWVVPYGRDEVRLELDSAWYDDGADDGGALAGWTLLERLIDAGLGGVGHASGLHGVLLEVHGELVAQRLGTWSQGEKSAEIKSVLEDAVDSGRLVVMRQPMQLPAMQNMLQPQDAEPVLGPDSTPAEDAAPSKTWVGIVLVDQDGTPVPNRPYRVVAPGGDVYEGQLDSNGVAMIRDLDAGSCKISCPYVEPHAELTHAVEPGEHISGIAQTYGFDDYTVVWNHANNADLKAKRAFAHELSPGDAVYVPELKDTPADKPTGAKHTFTIQVSPLKLVLKVVGLQLTPVASAPCTLDGASLTTDGGGSIQEPVDKTARAAFLNVQGLDLALQVGRLAPLDDESDEGWKARLFNLGFLLDPEAQDGDEELRIALQDFQAQYQLPVTGAFDDATKAQLQQVYGC